MPPGSDSLGSEGPQSANNGRKPKVRDRKKILDPTSFSPVWWSVQHLMPTRPGEPPPQKAGLKSMLIGRMVLFATPLKKGA